MDRIQEGVYFRSGETPPPHFRLLLINATPRAKPGAVGGALERVLRVLADLRRGKQGDLDGVSGGEKERLAESFNGLTALVGYGPRLFDSDLHAGGCPDAEPPPGLVHLRADYDAFPQLPWADRDGRANPGEADLALQLTAPSEAAVSRAAVEVCKAISDEGLPLEPASSFAGFGRSDGRGWLEFHDGVGNIDSTQRLAAIEAAADPEWMGGGTFMAFLRFLVDLDAWRALPRSQQELIVGRDKLTGAPLTGVERKRGQAVPVAAAEKPLAPELARAAHADPPQQTDALLEASHIHRANQNRASPHAPAGIRIFRQGYDFLESIDERGARVGLNFVSFQRDLLVLQHVLHLPGWLGDVNFGGPSDPGPGEPRAPRLIELLAGGFYAVPPRGRPFPGAALFAQ